MIGLIILLPLFLWLAAMVLSWLADLMIKGILALYYDVWRKRRP